MEKRIDKLLKALEEERLACRKEHSDLLSSYTTGSLVKIGLVCNGLIISNSTIGKSGGRMLVEFRRQDLAYIPPHQLRPGDLVRIGNKRSLKDDSKKDNQCIFGTLTKVRDECIELSIKGEAGEDLLDLSNANALWLLSKAPNEVPFDRQVAALKKVQDSWQKSVLLKAAFDETIELSPLYNRLEVKDTVLVNDGQREAVKHALSNPLTLIHGPPGTGKTATLIALCQILLSEKQQILMCAPSNLAVDNLIERLDALKLNSLRMVRLGHPAKILDSVLHYSLESLIDEEHGDVLADLRKSIKETVKKLPSLRGQEKREAYATLKADRKDLREREDVLTKKILESSQLILCTLSMAGCKLLQGKTFFTVIIDEGSQCMEGESWIAATKATERLVIAGDHCQLPPTVTIEDGKNKKVLTETLFERLSVLRPQCVLMLTMQYRMHEDIQTWSNKTFYEDKLVAHASVAQHLLCQLPNVKGEECTRNPIIFIDTLGQHAEEAESEKPLPGMAESKSNSGEAALANNYARELISTGISAKDIAVITPYTAQVQLIKSLLLDITEVEVGTVDGFQGREKEAIIFSFVRSNPECELGFLEDSRRTNVALTRARRHLCVIGDSETLSGPQGKKIGYDILVEHLYEQCVRYI